MVKKEFEKIRESLLGKIKEMEKLYNDDEKRDGGYSMVEYLNERAPEDYNDLRTDWETLRSYANDMWRMLRYIRQNIDELKEEVEDDLWFVAQHLQ